MSVYQSGRPSHFSHRSGDMSESQASETPGPGIEEALMMKSVRPEDERGTKGQNSGECRLMRAINETLGFCSRKCSTGCLYSMDELIPTGYLLLIEEQNNAWFHMQLSASCQSVQLWYADFSARLQEALDEEARGRLFTSFSTHVFAGAKRQTAGAPLHCRRFAYLPNEILNHPSLLLHHLPISPDQLLLIDHSSQAAAYVPVVVGFANQAEKHMHRATLSGLSLSSFDGSSKSKSSR